MKIKHIFLTIISFFIITPVMAQAPVDRVADLLNRGDYIELNRVYPTLKDSIPPVQRALTEAMLDVTFNRPEAALQSVGNVIGNYQQDIGFDNTINMLLILSTQQMKLGRYAESADMLKDFLSQLEGTNLPPEILANHRTQYRIAQSLRDFPQSELIRPDRDCKVPLDIKKAGKGWLMYIPVKIGGKEAPFIFDTGADEQAFVSEEFASAHGIRILTDSIETSGTVALGKSKIGVADSIQVGDIVYRNVHFTIAETDNSIKAEGVIELPDSLNFKLDAVLGSQFMEAVGEVQIYPKAKKVVFPAKLSPSPSWGSNMMNNVGQPYLEASSNGERLIFHLDTGNSMSDLSVNYYMKHKNDVEAKGRKESIGLGGFGGAKMMDVYTLPLFPLKVGNTPFELKNITVQTENTRIANQDGVLGMSFINLFDKITINFKDMFITVE